MKKKKVLIIVVCLIILLLSGASVYATTNGYENVFFLVKNLITGKNETEENEKILSDKDITISYENIYITDTITMKIEKLQIKDGDAKLIVRVDESEQDTNNLTPFIYKIYNESEKELASKSSLKSVENVSYTDEIIIKNYNKEDKILVLKVFTPEQELLSEINIDIEKRVVESKGVTEELKKISEIELKEYLGKYVILNTYDVVFDNVSYATREEWKNAMLVKIAMNRIYDVETKDNTNQEIKYTTKKVNTAIKEVTGEEVLGKIKLPDGEGVYYNEASKSYENVPGDGDISGLCIEIKHIKYINGVYQVKFTYCYPSEENYTLGNIDKLALYETTMRFKINEDYKYAKYCLIDIDENKYEKIKDSEIEDLDYDLDLDKDDNLTVIENTTNETNASTNSVSIDKTQVSTKDLLTNLKIYFTEVNNKGNGTKITFRKYEKGNTAKEVEEGTILLNKFIGKINNHVENIDNATTYTQWCSRDLSVEPEEEYLMMFMYDSHQTQITWSTERENQIVVLWYNDKIKDVEIDKINLDQSCKDMFSELMEDSQK